MIAPALGKKPVKLLSSAIFFYSPGYFTAEIAWLHSVPVVPGSVGVSALFLTEEHRAHFKQEWHLD